MLPASPPGSGSPKQEDSSASSSPGSSNAGASTSYGVSSSEADKPSASGLFRAPNPPAEVDPAPFLTVAGHNDLSSGAGEWDPTGSKNNKALTNDVRRRVQSEILNALKNPIEGIYMTVDEEEMSNVHAIVLGPKGTPYAGGLFYFFIKIPADYPWKPPQVKLMTTCNGTVRFNPNLYASGKVCLSILGTWAGPSWTPSLTLQSVLLSIQSLMNEEPFYNEPFYEGKQKYRNTRKMAEEYSEDIRFHTLRVAVLDMVEGTNGDTQSLPDALRERLVSLFKENYANYLRIINENLESTKYSYESLKTRLTEVKGKLDKGSKKPKQWHS